jgi:Xaa-Pro dipeptidase
MPMPPGPVLTLAERDRRWAGLRAIMAARDLDAIVVGSFQGRERLESYLIDDFLDAIVVLPRESEPVVLAFSTSRVSRMFESQRRGVFPWVADVRIGFGGHRVVEVLRERGLARGRLGLVGLSSTAPGESEGLVPYNFYQKLDSELSDLAIEDFTRDLTDFMLLKSEEELALMRFAALVSERACEAMLEASAVGASEADVYAAIVATVYRWGCELRYPFLSLQSGPDNIAWGVPRWTVRAEAPRILQPGDLIQAEIHTTYGGQESQVQMSVALDPVADVILACQDAAEHAYAAGVRAVVPNATFADVVAAMEAPLRATGMWSKTPLAHTATFGATGFTPINREQLAGTPEAELERNPVGIRRGDLILKPGMCLELEPNACRGTHRVNIGGMVAVTPHGAEELNVLPTRVHHR